MSERSFRIGTSRPELGLDREAKNETRKSIRQPKEEIPSAEFNSAEKIRDLTDHYNSIMEQYDQIADQDEGAAEELLKRANEILNKLNELSPGIRPKKSIDQDHLEIPEDWEKEADELTKKINSTKIN